MYRVLLIYQKKIPSVILCASIQLEYLQNCQLIKLEENSIFHVTRKQCMLSDIIVLVRGSTKSESIFAEKMKKWGKYIVYVLDDDLLNIPSYSSSSVYFKENAVRDSVVKLIREADVFAATSEIILRKYKSLGKRVLIKEAVEVFDISHKIVRKKVRLGFAGSVDRTYEFESILSKVLHDLKQKYNGKLMIECIGIMPASCGGDIDRCFDYQDSYLEYIELMKQRKWDIGLAPLFSSEFNCCKYFNKYLEYGRFGIIGIYSDVLPYSGKIVDGVNGILVKNTQEAWFSALDKLIQDQLNGGNYCDFLRERILEDISEHYSVDKCAGEFYDDILKECCKRESRNVGAVEFYIMLFKIWFIRIYYGGLRRFCRLPMVKKLVSRRTKI